MGGISVIYDPDQKDNERLNGSAQELVSWVMTRVTDWEDHRDNNYEQRWNEYYRIWRGVYKKQDQTRESERSRLISPATSQAIEVAASEIEEAIFGKGKWFDVSDDVRDLDKADMAVFRNALLEDLNEAGFPRAISEAVLNGCIYGTGIGKLSVEEKDVAEFSVTEPQDFNIAEFTSTTNKKVYCTLTPVEPREFAIDPTARTIDEALGCSHSQLVPKHDVTMKIQDGTYRNVSVGDYINDFDFEAKGETKSGTEEEVQVTTYQGLVPRKMLDYLDLEEDESFVEFEDESEEYLNNEELVEAIVTIGNETELLKAVENPYVMKDRDFIAYQHDTVPNRFWGRGIAEKGYNPQKALDAELRGRIDAMGLAIHPMMAIDATRIPRGGDFSVRPGKNILVNGDPRQALMPFNFGQVGTNTFQESGDLERMIQMATGSMDSATPVSSNSRNSTASGMSMIQAGAIKRSKRTLANIEAQFIKPLVKKAAWRLMQFDPETYPPTDPKFIVNSTLGIMARELEMNQLTNLLSTTQGNTVGYWMLMLSIYEHSSVANREQMMQIAQQQLQNAMNPQPDQVVVLKQQEMAEKKEFDMAKLKIEGSRAQTEARRVSLEEAKTGEVIKKTQADTKLIETKAESERRTTIVETETALKSQQNKEKELEIKTGELALKKRGQDIDVELEKNKILLEKDQMESEERKACADRAAAHGPERTGKKKITVKHTKTGLEGFSEEIPKEKKEKPEVKPKVNKITVTRTDEGLEGFSEEV